MHSWKLGLLRFPLESWDMFPTEFRKIFQSFRTPDVGWDMIVNQNLFIEEILRKQIVRRLTARRDDTLQRTIQKTRILVLGCLNIGLADISGRYEAGRP